MHLAAGALDLRQLVERLVELAAQRVNVDVALREQVARAAALLIADLLARIVFAPEVLPVGILTALAGVPFFLWLLRRAKIQLFW